MPGSPQVEPPEDTARPGIAVLSVIVLVVPLSGTFKRQSEPLMSQPQSWGIHDAGACDHQFTGHHDETRQ